MVGSGLRIPGRSEMLNPVWLFLGCVYQYFAFCPLENGYRPWLFQGSVYPAIRSSADLRSYRPWLFPGSVYIVGEDILNTEL